MAKDKKKEKKAKKANKRNKSDVAALLKSEPAKAATKKVKEWSKNPLVGEVVAAALVGEIVAAALVATAAALKDSRKAQRLAADAGDELEKLSKKGAERGNALWQMALEIGRRSLEEINESAKAKSRK